MEMASHSFSCTKSIINPLSPPLFSSKSTIFAQKSINYYKYLPRNLIKCSSKQLRNYGTAISASSDSQSNISDTPNNGSFTWLLQPIGDGDSRHIGFKVAMPGAFEISSNVVTVGRVRDKADLVIPVPTVSGLHARIQSTEESLLITDLDSTNGTFIDEKRLQPGIVYGASPGNLITFGDTNLAIFRVYKLEKEESAEPENSGTQIVENEASNNVLESSS